MFCPTCGSEERHPAPFCRGCGTDLRAVKLGLERPDSITASAVSAREDIGRAIAAKIRETHSADELKKVAEDVLPQIEKFLESPEERRLRRLRAGVIMGATGLGVVTLAAVLSSVLVQSDEIAAAMFVLGGGVILFFIGLGVIMNGLAFTRPRKQLEDRVSGLNSNGLTGAGLNAARLPTAEEGPPMLRSPATSDLPSRDRSQLTSVTEHTTHHLKVE